jgi:hypothetical protein
MAPPPKEYKLHPIKETDAHDLQMQKRLGNYIMRCLDFTKGGETSLNRLSAKMRRPDGINISHQSLNNYIQCKTDVNDINEKTLQAIASYPAWFNNYRSISVEQLRNYVNNGEYEVPEPVALIEAERLLATIDQIEDNASLVLIAQRALSRMVFPNNNSNGNGLHPEKKSVPKFNLEIIRMLKEREVKVVESIKFYRESFGQEPSHKSFEEYCEQLHVFPDDVERIEQGVEIDHKLLAAIANVLNVKLDGLIKLKNDLSD